MIRIVVRDYAQVRVPAGATLGRLTMAKLLAAVPPASHEDKVVLDFNGIQFASASFLRESVLGLRNALHGRQLDVWVANASEAVQDDVDELLRGRNETLVTCVVDKGQISAVQLRGDLEAGLRKAFEAVITHGAVTAQTLHKLIPGDRVGVTAWNNRLAALAELGLVKGERQGRAKVYRSLLMAVNHGT